MTELIETERLYVEELQSIIEVRPVHQRKTFIFESLTVAMETPHVW